MPELRWSLLILGLLFLVGLAVWELRKQRRSGASSADALRSETATSGTGREMSESSLAAADHVAERGAEEFADAGLRADARARRREEPGLDLSALRADREPLPRVPVIEIDGPGTEVRGESAAAPLDVQAEAALGATTSAAVTAQSAADRAAAWLAEAPAEAQQSPLVLDWPPEDRRHIVALRLVPRTGEKFTGAALRQALTGEGFRHGEFDIFHRPLSDGRVIVSAASLTRPGGFALEQMDAQLFPGISLFSVLPGPLPSRECFERLLLVGRTLAQRVGGQLLDSRGQALSESRLLEMRRQVAAVPSSATFGGGGGEPPQAAASA